MRVPQVSERIKEAPAQALRGVFAGIGQLLLITDKLRNKTPTYSSVPRTRRPEPPEAVADKAATEPAAPRAEAAAPAPAQPAAAEAVQAEGVQAEAAQAEGAQAEGVQTEAVQAEAAQAEGVQAEAVQAEAAPESPQAAKPPQARDFDKTGNVRLLDVEESPAVAPASPAVPAASPAGVVESLPLSNYGELSLASLRARLRNLDVAQLRQLTEYERAHEARGDVIVMFERRIAKLEAEA